MSRLRMIGVALLLAVLPLAGCAGRRLAPVADGVVINTELRSASRTEQGVTVTVQASAWRGRSDVERYVTPLHVTVQNHTAKGVSFGFQDLVLFDEGRTQYNPLAPESVVQIIRSDISSALAYAPLFTPFFIGSRFGFFHPFGDPFFFHDPFFPRFAYLPPAPYPRADDVVTEALIPGTVRPNAQVQGFVYFAKLPPEVQRVAFHISYEVQGEPARRGMEFSFALEPGGPK